MSTVPIILVQELPGGRLCKFLPPFKGRESEVRKLSIASEMHVWLYEQEPNPAMRIKDAIRAHFGEFVRGEPVDDLDYMKRVEDRRRHPVSFSHGVWAISPRFKPQFRFFGFFAIAGWFIALNRQRRDALTTDAAWHAEIDKALDLWGQLFPGRDPWLRDNLIGYIPSNGEKRDDRW